MDSFFGSSPWDFGTGVMGATGLGGTQPIPTPPPTDLAQTLAGSLAAQGIRPDQFMANPQGVAQALQAPAAASGGAGGAGASPWDPTPVSVPGGPPVQLPGQPQTQGNPNVPTDGALAAAAPADAAAAQKPFGTRLAETLKGITPPKPPVPQTVRTPEMPRTANNVKSGALMAALMGLSPQAQNVAVPLALGRSIR